MLFTYYYKSSDGMRHEGEVSASSREEAFAELRRQGVRPIKVIAKPTVFGQREYGYGKRTIVLWSVLAVLVTVVLFSAFMLFGRWQSNVNELGYCLETYSAYTNLVYQAKVVRTTFTNAAAHVDFALMRNYALLEHSTNIDEFLQEAEKGQVAVETAQRSMRSLFRNLMEMFPPSAIRERQEAQQLYGEVMCEVDAFSDNLEENIRILQLLHDSRGKWSVHHGELGFTDVQLKLLINARE